MYFIFNLAGYVIMFIAALLTFRKPGQQLVRISALLLCIAVVIMLINVVAFQFLGAYIGFIEFLSEMSPITRVVTNLLFLTSVILFRFYAFRRVLIDNEVNNGSPTFLTTLGYFFITVPLTCIVLSSSRQEKAKLKVFIFSILALIGFAVVYVQGLISYSSLWVIKLLATALIAGCWYVFKTQQEADKNVQDELNIATLYGIIAICITFNPYFW